MTELSPAAQAVKDAVLALYVDRNVHEFGWQLDAPTVAAALRAAADQVVPDEPDYMRAAIPDTGWWGKHDLIRSELLAIADELEAL